MLCGKALPHPAVNYRKRRLECKPPAEDPARRSLSPGETEDQRRKKPRSAPFYIPGDVTCLLASHWMTKGCGFHKSDERCGRMLHGS
ncbi:hypothetical protein GDO78_019614 [Eleutherodactylus coqui]|uniref:Uncharacterized protein n=1 Tax=Eleutherodactylus coqui TaxID=57060 RepID=A0A8J6EJ39_ELECQ|nr:hypothetical protein GDO78_019614 [Eleutherodactylus coqui]